MPRQHRYQIKQELDTASHAVERAMERLVITGQQFQEHHPDLYEMFCSIVSTLNVTKECITELSGRI